MTQEQMTRYGVKPFSGFPIPPDMALVCPLCEEYKMREWLMHLFKCANPKCHHVMPAFAVEQYIAMKVCPE